MSSTDGTMQTHRIEVGVTVTDKVTVTFTVTTALCTTTLDLGLGIAPDLEPETVSDEGTSELLSAEGDSRADDVEVGTGANDVEADMGADEGLELRERIDGGQYEKRPSWTRSRATRGKREEGRN